MLADILVVAVIGGGCVLAVRKILKDKKNGCNSCGGSCGGSCSGCNKCR